MHTHTHTHTFTYVVHTQEVLDDVSLVKKTPPPSFYLVDPRGPPPSGSVTSSQCPTHLSADRQWQNLLNCPIKPEKVSTHTHTQNHLQHARPCAQNMVLICSAQKKNLARITIPLYGAGN